MMVGSRSLLGMNAPAVPFDRERQRIDVTQPLDSELRQGSESKRVSSDQRSKIECTIGAQRGSLRINMMMKCRSILHHHSDSSSIVTFLSS